MCPFDVVSLFTNVPLEETIKICADALYRDDDIDPLYTALSEESFCKFLRLVTSGVEFSFNDTICMLRQKDGVAMGSPLGPVLAGISSLAGVSHVSRIQSGLICIAVLWMTLLLILIIARTVISFL